MRVSYTGSSDGDGPTREQMERWRKRTSPPDNELPAGVGLTVLLGRTGDAAVGITQIEAFSTGFRFTLAVRLRQVRPELAHGGLFDLISSHIRPGREVALADRLLLGIEYANGHRASTVQDMRKMMPGGEAAEQDLVLMQQGGSAGEQTADKTYWVCPLPAEGPVTFVLAWPGFGMPESRTVVDGDLIRAASQRSQQLWPLQPLAEPPQLSPPPRPSTGWFADPSD